MTSTLRKCGFFAAIVLLSCLAVPAMAQNQPDNGGAGGGGGQGGGRRGNFDPAQMQQRMMDRLKDEMGATDDEFKVLQPKIEKVMKAQRDARGGGFGGPGGFGGRRGGGNGGPNGGGANGGGGQTAAPADAPAADVSPVQKSLRDLRTLLQDKDAKADDIKTKLAAVRDAKAKAKEDLTKAQGDLKEVLTQRQEAVLVMSGMIE